jgi:ferric-dicitrate binding protein FerR (iron transport regulator)
MPRPGGGTSSSGSYVAQLVTAGPNVTVKSKGRRVSGSPGLYLYAGDVVTTSGDSYARVRFRDGDEVWLDYQTEVRIGSLDIFFGRVFAVVQGVFTIDSEFVTAGSEGTEFSVTVNRPNRGDYSVSVKKGVVRCSSPRRKWQTLRVSRGERLSSKKHLVPKKVQLKGPLKQREFNWVKRLSRGPEPIRQEPVDRTPVQREPVLY